MVLGDRRGRGARSLRDRRRPSLVTYPLVPTLFTYLPPAPARSIVCTHRTNCNEGRDHSVGPSENERVRFLAMPCSARKVSRSPVGCEPPAYLGAHSRRGPALRGAWPPPACGRTLHPSAPPMAFGQAPAGDTARGSFLSGSRLPGVLPTPLSRADEGAEPGRKARLPTAGSWAGREPTASRPRWPRPASGR